MTQGGETNGSGTERRSALLVLSYYGVYMAYHFRRPESDPMHWLGLVLLPFVVLYLFERRGGGRSVRHTLESVGLRRGNLRTGVGWAIVLGLSISALMTFASRKGPEVWDVLLSARALYMLPIAFVFLLLTAAFTEEFFFRGVLQTRLTDWTRSRVAGVLITAVLFGAYHIPYAYLKPSWPTYGDLGAAIPVAMWEGGLGGLILGAVFVFAKRNLVAAILVHALIDLLPAVALIKFGGG